ncbi:hypothetical protein ScalyP_jg2652 [Parmales sp. scaly parma]|nr:hypothetical protein ScalyP_jg2652 [Parmales sp. scaly parma]
MGGFVKVVKSSSYFSRFQVKYKRRREGKTDYRQRKRLCAQDKNKYQAPKYRLVVRFSNKNVICQIAYATLGGDRVMVHASSAELGRYGLEVGLKNYAAAYCTGLLCARRLLNQLKLDKVYEGNTEIDGEVVSCQVGKKTYYVEEVDEDKRPFRALLDVGTKATTTGSRVFGALKGAADGGLDIPHSNKRFPGYDRDQKQFDAEMHQERILGGHVGEYMEYLEEEDNAKYLTHFSEFVKRDIGFDDLEDLYKGVHEKIREDPTPAKKVAFTADKSFKRPAKHTYEVKKAAVQAKKDAKMAEGDEDSD